MTVRQLLAAAAPGDATTAHALAVHERLDGEGEIYASLVHERLAGVVRPLAALDAAPARAGDVLLIHLSIGRPDVVAAALARSEPAALYFHNVSPADVYEPFSPRFAEELRLGLAHLHELRERVSVAVAASRFSAADLEAAGYAHVEVVPLAISAEGLCGVEPDAAVRGWFETRPGPVHVCVGQLLPHKRPDFLLATAHVLASATDPTATVVLVGAQRLAAYVPTIERYAEELRLTNVVLTNEVTVAELVAYYEGATTCVFASEHEGFGMPLLEAMAFGRPVLARSFGAVPEVVGDAALLLAPAAGPTVMAEAATRLARDDTVRAELVRRGRRRLEAFDPLAAADRLIALACG